MFLTDVFNIFRIDLCKCHSALPYNNYTSVKKMSKKFTHQFLYFRLAGG